MNKYANLCKACAAERKAQLHAEADAIVAAGKCPQFGAGLKRNNALTGWWQCATTGIGQPNKCGFQCFTS
jgi:hypothetical protein